MAEVVLVDEWDREVGVAEKLAAHQGAGLLHRAFSVFVFDTSGRLLLQRRAAAKYHFGGLWTNSCCSHPAPGRPIGDEARRRLGEELGLDCDLRRAGTFTYTAADPSSGLVERELDHVFVGMTDDRPEPDPDEVDEVRYVYPSELPDVVGMTSLTPWFLIGLGVALGGDPRRRPTRRW